MRSLSDTFAELDKAFGTLGKRRESLAQSEPVGVVVEVGRLRNFNRHLDKAPVIRGDKTRPEWTTDVTDVTDTGKPGKPVMLGSRVAWSELPLVIGGAVSGSGENELSDRRRKRPVTSSTARLGSVTRGSSASRRGPWSCVPLPQPGRFHPWPERPIGVSFAHHYG